MQIFSSLMIFLAIFFGACTASADPVIQPPAALDMTEPIEYAENEFDFLPWYTPMDEAMSLFGLDEGDYVRTDYDDASGTAILEFAYPATLTGEDSQLQLMFEQMEYDAGTGERADGMFLIGIRTIDTFDSHAELIEYMEKVSVRWNDMMEREVISLSMKRLIPKWDDLIKDIASDPDVSSRCTNGTTPKWADPTGTERKCRMRLHVGATLTEENGRKFELLMPIGILPIGTSGTIFEYRDTDAPYFATYTYMLEIPY